eukprot:745905-Hanusia_phi.AAC.3
MFPEQLSTALGVGPGPPGVPAAPRLLTHCAARQRSWADRIAESDDPTGRLLKAERREIEVTPGFAGFRASPAAARQLPDVRYEAARSSGTTMLAQHAVGRFLGARDEESERPMVLVHLNIVIYAMTYWVRRPQFCLLCSLFLSSHLLPLLHLFSPSILLFFFSSRPPFSSPSSLPSSPSGRLNFFLSAPVLPAFFFPPRHQLSCPAIRSSGPSVFPPQMTQPVFPFLSSRLGADSLVFGYLQTFFNVFQLVVSPFPPLLHAPTLVPGEPFDRTALRLQGSQGSSADVSDINRQLILLTLSLSSSHLLRPELRVPRPSHKHPLPVP